MKVTEQQYEVRREHIREQFQTMRNRANAYRDQQLAKLFYESGWTQREIAEKEGRSHTWVQYRLRFGRFEAFLETNVSKVPVNLTEGRFRGLWSEHVDKNVTANTPAETRKFQAIIDSKEWQTQLADKLSFPTTDMIKDRCIDNKWRTFEEISELIEEPDDGANRVPNGIQRIKATHSGGLMVMEKKFAGGVSKYKFKEIRNKESIKIRAITVAEELSPIVEELHRALSVPQSSDAVGLIKGQMPRLINLVKRYS